MSFYTFRSISLGYILRIKEDVHVILTVIWNCLHSDYTSLHPPSHVWEQLFPIASSTCYFFLIVTKQIGEILYLDIVLFCFVSFLWGCFWLCHRAHRFLLPLTRDPTHQGSSWCLLQWKQGILSTGLSGSPLYLIIVLICISFIMRGWASF